MTLIDLSALLGLAAVAVYVYMLGRGERGEAVSRAWPLKRAGLPDSEPAEEGALIPEGEPERAGMEPRKAA